MICIDLIIVKNDRHRGFWKLNMAHLTEIDYVNAINKVIENTFKENDNEKPSMKWEMIKIVVAGESIQYLIKRDENRNEEINAIVNKIKKIEKSIKQDDDQESLQHKNKEIEIGNKMLENLNQYKTQDEILRSKAKWYEEGEKNTKYFFNLVKINYTKNV